jgi:hypothetical protein
MKIRHVSPRLFASIFSPATSAWLLLVLLTLTPVSGQQADTASGKDAPASEQPDSADVLEKLIGQTVQIALVSGKTIDDAEVTKIKAGAKPGQVKSLSVKLPPKGRIQLVAAATVDEIFVAGAPLDVAYDRKTTSLSVSPEKRQKRLDKIARVASQLKAKRAILWPEYTDKEQAEFVEEQKKFLNTVGAAFSQLPMTLYETKFYLFYTDMPQPQIAGYIELLDDMYNQLCVAFGIPPGKNIWRGKCPVIAFIEESSFLEFERKIMENNNAKGAQGIHHGYSDGKVVVSCFRGGDPLFFGSVLVHETSHGFLHRYRSSIHIPSWINEGIADWIAAAVVTADKSIERRQQSAITQLSQTGNMGGDFFTEEKNIDQLQYGMASSMTDTMLKWDGKKYRQFIDGIKEGLDWQEALKESYGLSLVELVQRYGQSIGVPNLRP